MGLVYQTLGFVRALTSLVVFFALAYALWGDLERREVRAWVAAFGCTLIGASLYLIPEAGPGAHLGNFLGRNSFLALSAGLQWVGSAWLHPGSRKRPWAALLPLALLGFLLLFLRDTFPGRALAFSLAVSPFLLGAAVHLHRIPHAPARGHARAGEGGRGPAGGRGGRRHPAGPAGCGRCRGGPAAGGPGAARAAAPAGAGRRCPRVRPGGAHPAFKGVG